MTLITSFPVYVTVGLVSYIIYCTSFLFVFFTLLLALFLVVILLTYEKYQEKQRRQWTGASISVSRKVTKKELLDKKYNSEPNRNLKRQSDIKATELRLNRLQIPTKAPSTNTEHFRSQQSQYSDVWGSSDSQIHRSSQSIRSPLQTLQTENASPKISSGSHKASQELKEKNARSFLQSIGMPTNPILTTDGHEFQPNLFRQDNVSAFSPSKKNKDPAAVARLRASIIRGAYEQSSKSASKQTPQPIRKNDEATEAYSDEIRDKQFSQKDTAVRKENENVLSSHKESIANCTNINRRETISPVQSPLRTSNRETVNDAPFISKIRKRDGCEDDKTPVKRVYHRKIPLRSKHKRIRDEVDSPSSALAYDKMRQQDLEERQATAGKVHRMLASISKKKKTVSFGGVEYAKEEPATTAAIDNNSLNDKHSVNSASIFAPSMPVRPSESNILPSESTEKHHFSFSTTSNFVSNEENQQVNTTSQEKTPLGQFNFTSQSTTIPTSTTSGLFTSMPSSSNGQEKTPLGQFNFTSQSTTIPTSTTSGLFTMPSSSNGKSNQLSNLPADTSNSTISFSSKPTTSTTSGLFTPISSSSNGQPNELSNITTASSNSTISFLSTPLVASSQQSQLQESQTIAMSTIQFNTTSSAPEATSSATQPLFNSAPSSFQLEQQKSSQQLAVAPVRFDTGSSQTSFQPLASSHNVFNSNSTIPSPPIAFTPSTNFAPSVNFSVQAAAPASSFSLGDSSTAKSSTRTRLSRRRK